MSWIDSILPIAQIATQVLPLIFGEEEDDSTPFEVGPIRFKTMDDPGGRPLLIAENNSLEDVSMLLTLTEGRVDDKLVTLPYGRSAEVSHLFNEYKEGLVTLVPSLSADEDSGWRALSGAFRWVGIGTVITMLNGGVQFDYQRTSSGFSFKIKSSGAIQNVDLTLTDPYGSSVRFKANSKDLEKGDELELPIPSGVDLDPQAATIQVSLEVPQAAYEAAAAEQRHLLLPA